MAGELVECLACKKIGKSELKGSFLISFILFWFLAIIPGVIYMIWRRSGLGLCKACHSDNVVPYNSSNRKIIDQSSVVSVQNNNNVEQIQCPDCREYIRHDARKCKHCGSYLT